MNAPAHQIPAPPSVTTEVHVSTGPRVLDAAELLLVSGGAPRGGWELPTTEPESVAALPTVIE